MKKLKFVLPSLLSISLVPAICLASTGCAKESQYHWSITGEHFSYQLISNKKGEKFKLKIVADSGYAISTSSYFTINNGDQRELQLYDNVLTITPDKIDGKIKIHVVTIPLPRSINLTYGEGETEDVVLVEGNTLDFNVTIDPAQYADSVTLISENENIAKFQGNTLIPVGEGNVSVKAAVQAYGVKIESNSIKVEVQAKPATHTINDDNVPLQIEPIYGADEVGFIFRNFKADFNIRTEAVTPSIIWNDSTNADSASIQIVNISNDQFNKSTFDIYVTYEKAKYDLKQHLINIQIQFPDASTPFKSKQLTMLYKEASKAKTVDASKVPTQATVNNGQIILTGFSTNFKFTEDGENQINFEITNNSVDVVSDSIININYDSVTQTTTFDLLLEVAIRDLAAGGIGISIYLDNVYITTINTDIDYGETIMSDLAYEVRFVNGAKPYAKVAAYYQTNFDFRVEGEQVDEKPLLTAEWPAGIPFPSPIKATVERVGERIFNILFEWDHFINVSSYDTYYIFKPIIKSNGKVVQSITDSYGVLCIETIREASDLKTNVIMTENEAGNSTLSLCSFIRGSVPNSNCDFKFKSDSPLLKDSNPTIGFDSSILYFDGISSEIIKLEWDHKIEITEPTKFLIAVDKKDEGYNLLPWTEFTIIPPNPTSYWSIDCESECQNSELEVIKNTREEIQLKVKNIKTNYEFFGVYVKQRGFEFNQVDLSKLDDEGIITINPIQDDPDYCLKPNADIIVATIYYDPSVDQNNIVLNNYFDAAFLAPETNGVKNDKPMTLKGNEQYYLNVDMKNFEFRSQKYVESFNFFIGNIKSASSLILRNICQGSELFINGVALVPMSITLGSYSMLMFDLPESVPVEDAKNWDVKILAITDKDAMDCEFNLVFG